MLRLTEIINSKGVDRMINENRLNLDRNQMDPKIWRCIKRAT